ncbi:substrate-binding domain-containing protein [Massilia sp. W12]|uniref:substrate-binding domain-containing protein n=1 Tax=Massilia sp. W12 TaxID=3126507 RepID=UPI0030D090BE
MKKTLTGVIAFVLAAGSLPAYVQAQESPALFVSRANARIAKSMAFKNKWDGPTSGPKMPGKAQRIILITSDMRDTSIQALHRGLKEAASAAGWELHHMDTWSLPYKRADAFARAMALKPDGLILAGLNAKDVEKEIQSAKIPVVGWHASNKLGPTDNLFTNIGTDPKDVGQSAALLSVLESNGKAGVVIVTNPNQLYSVAKSNEVVETIKQCQTCSVLALEEIPLMAANEKIPLMLTNMAKQHGKRWTHTIVVNDMYIDAMTGPTSEAPLAEVKDMHTLSAGSGVESAYKRIRNQKLQFGTVPEPVNMQAWQLIDELNRAFAKEKPSLYSPPAYVVTQQNMVFNGGKANYFDPDNGYRNEYKKIWGK